LVVIRISIWMQDRIEGFFTVAKPGKPVKNMVLPPGEHNGKIDTALAEVCGLRAPFYSCCYCIGRHSAVPEQQEQIVTPFAQILHTLHNVHKNYILLTNASSNRSTSRKIRFLSQTIT